MEYEKSKPFRPQWRWGIVIASGLNYAGVTLLMLFWGRSEFFFPAEVLMYFIILMFSVSFMMGALLVDLERAFVYSILGLIIGNAIAVTIFLAPYNMFGESVGAVNVATLVVLSAVGKHLLISIAPYLVGTILGCFMGESLTRLK